VVEHRVDEDAPVKQKRVFREWQHPRDGRGRFSRSGGASWAKRAAEGFAKAEEGRPTKPPVAGRPRIGRNAKAGAILNQHVPGAGDALSRKWTPPPKIPPGGALRTRTSEVNTGQDQFFHDGEWRTVTGMGYGADKGDYVMYRTEDGKSVTVPFPGGGLVTRPAVVEFHEPLRKSQLPQMDAWRADATRPPQVRTRTNREENIDRHTREVAEKEKALKEAMRKARSRVRRKYPSSDGYDRRDWDFYVGEEEDVRRAERDLHFPRLYLKQAQQTDTDPDTEKRLNEPGYGFAVLDGELDRDRPLAVYGDLLHIEDDDQATYRHLRDLSLVPAELHALVARVMATERGRLPVNGKSTGIWLGSRPVPRLDHAQALATEEPRGWGSGRTWNEVDGAYSPHERRLMVGVSTSSPSRGEHGQPALHEFGHAVDHAIGGILRETDRNFPDRAAHDPEWRKVHAQVVAAAPDMNPYFKQDGEAGPVEMWAEAFGEWARARAKARQSELYARAVERGGAAAGNDFLASRAGMAMRREFSIPHDNAAAAAALNTYFESLAARLGVEL
jgi:hypothetical protein